MTLETILGCSWNAAMLRTRSTELASAYTTKKRSTSDSSSSWNKEDQGEMERGRGRRVFSKEKEKKEKTFSFSSLLFTNNNPKLANKSCQSWAERKEENLRKEECEVVEKKERQQTLPFDSTSLFLSLFKSEGLDWVCFFSFRLDGIREMHLLMVNTLLLSHWSIM